MTDPAEPVFSPSPEASAASSMARFRAYVAERSGRELRDYAALQRFSLSDPSAFWGHWLAWSRIRVSGTPTPVLSGTEIETARFFLGLRLNYAENLLAGSDEAPALSTYDERGATGRRTRGELRREVARTAALLQSLGVQEGDRVAAIVRNTADAIVACLATSAIGAVWSSVAPDLGPDATLHRFRQLAPAVLFAHGSTHLQGMRRSLDDRLRSVVDGLPSLRALIALDPEARLTAVAPAIIDLDAAPEASAESWPSVPFNHPLFILFSSGTTGPPKCIVHGAGGTLLEHRKELELHTDLGPADTLYFHTSAGWMMWNWQLSALASGAEVVLYDGSVSFPEPDSLLRILDESGVSVFGTSPAYLQFLRESGISPRQRFAFNRLRAILSTGSVLPASAYDWCDAEFKHVPLQSISGGTDIIGCFVLGNPELPVYRGESQCVTLGYDVRAVVDDEARPTGRGELVCCAPFPSRPVGFWGDADGTRFHEAYFARHEGLWTHGDLIDLTERGTARVLGRTDGTMNIRGVRIGPAEVLQVVSEIPGIRQAMVIEQRAPREPGGSRMVLLVVLADGTTLDRPLQLRIKRELATRASTNHVPAAIADLPELPTTFSGKLSERAARDAANGDVVTNAGALRNPAILDLIRAHIALAT